jgi:hypothetical protein
MRISALLILLSLTAASGFAAEPQPLPPSQSPNLTVLRDGSAVDSASLLRPDSADGSCFKLRTYVMKREGIGDSTRLAKYYTCQKASKYGVKRAVNGPASEDHAAK